MKLSNLHIKLFMVIIISFVSYGCGEKPPLAVWKTTSGKEYKILKIGKLYFRNTGDIMLTVRYLSKDPKNPKIRDEEFNDIYFIIAKNVKIEGYTHVGLDAVDKAEPKFGISRSSVYRDNKTVEEVKKLAIGEKL